MDALPKTKQRIEAGIAQGLHPGAQVCVWRGDACVADAGLGEARPGVPMLPETMTLWLSAGKPITAIAIAQQVEAGAIELTDPVAEYVPEFAANGKEAVTIRDVLTHTGGFRSVVYRYPEQSWDDAIAAVCRARLETGWEVGQTAGYHPHSGWNILGKVLEVCSDQPVGEHLRDAVLLPWGMTSSWVGMADTAYDAAESRLADVLDTSRPEREPVSKKLHTRPWVVGQRPGGNAWGPARELARFYRALLSGGELDGTRLVDSTTIENLIARHRRDTTDRTFRAVMDWGLGFMVNNRRHDAANAEKHGETGAPYGFGPHASDRAFGHGGNQTSIGMADPEHDLAIVVVFNGMPGDAAHQQRMHAVLGAIYEDLGLQRQT